MQRLFHRLAFGDAWRGSFDVAELGRHDRALAIERIAKRVNHAADHGIADRHGEELAEGADLVTFVDRQIVAEDGNADAILFQVEHDAADARGELDHFAAHRARQAIDAGHAVAYFEHRADFADVDLAFVMLDLLLDDRGNFISIEFHGNL